MREGTKALSTRVPDLLGRTGTEYDVESMPCFQAAPFPACPALQIAWPRVGGGRAACFGPPKGRHHPGLSGVPGQGVPASRRCSLQPSCSLLAQLWPVFRNTPAPPLRSLWRHKTATPFPGQMEKSRHRETRFSPESPGVRGASLGERPTGFGAICRRSNRPEPQPGSLHVSHMSHMHVSYTVTGRHQCVHPPGRRVFSDYHHPPHFPG